MTSSSLCATCLSTRACCCGCVVQGDKEAKAGLPVSPMCNRTNMCMPKAQIGFINIFLKVGCATIACWA